MEIKSDPRGSIWRRWDLHIHTKGTQKNDQFTSLNFDTYCEVLFKKALEYEISAIGITDYFSIENYLKVKEYVTNIDSKENFNEDEKEAIKNIFLLPNVELRMLPVTDRGKLVNLHCIFNPSYVDSLENDFFTQIKHSGGTGSDYLMNKRGFEELGKSLDQRLVGNDAYKKGVNNFVVEHGKLKLLLENNRNFRNNVLIVVSNSKNDGASGFQKHYDLFEDIAPGSLDGVRKSIYSISDAIFSSNESDIKYFVGEKKDSIETVISKCGTIKPCIHGSDAHTEEKLFRPDDDRFCWIKADLTFEGLKQIIYEPQAGERVAISPIMPDHKDSFKTISKINFSHSRDFPDEIVFNKNLCAIIGSRSSGKSALLAYLAHTIEPITVEKLIKGPGEGDDFSWAMINNSEFDYQVTWNNEKTNSDFAGKIVYIPQNHLFQKSKNPIEIKERIAPIFFKTYPEFKKYYESAEKKIELENRNIEAQVTKWYRLMGLKSKNHEAVRDLGDEAAISEEKENNEKTIVSVKEKYSLNEEEVKNYKDIKTKIVGLENNKKKATEDLELVANINQDEKYFSDVSISLVPDKSSLPTQAIGTIEEILEEFETLILAKVNTSLITFKEELDSKLGEYEQKLDGIKLENKELITKYEKNTIIEQLINKNSEFDELLKEITVINEIIKDLSSQIERCIESIKMSIVNRKTILNELVKYSENINQDKTIDITFGVEYNFDENLQIVEEQINMRDSTQFVKNHELNISEVRNMAEQFLNAIYSGEQKIIQNYEKMHVAIDTLTLTEKILFTAKMEGDNIGGFSETTMTPGKRALFWLKLILSESDDKWPLLIDQPEDDLDSRSIFDEVVPFLKEKKKERQIILVSHNANLVIGADSEQVIIANRNGTDRKNEDGKQFNYLSGSLESNKTKDNTCVDTLKAQGIQEHACDILDGGKAAFEKRRNKYSL